MASHNPDNAPKRRRWPRLRLSTILFVAIVAWAATLRPYWTGTPLTYTTTMSEQLPMDGSFITAESYAITVEQGTTTLNPALIWPGLALVVLIAWTWAWHLAVRWKQNR